MDFLARPRRSSFGPAIGGALLRQLALDANCDTAEVASQLGITVRHLNRIFREKGDETPYRHLTRERINKAKELIRRDPTRRLKEIASDCGFSSSSHFSVAFKRETGQRAADFQRRQKPKTTAAQKA